MANITTNVAVDQATVVVREVAANIVELQVPAQPAVVEVLTPGPQGPPGQDGVTELAALTDVNTTAKVDGSVLYYDSGSGQWKGDDINTVITITDGGNFAVLLPLLLLLLFL